MLLFIHPSFPASAVMIVSLSLSARRENLAVTDSCETLVVMLIHHFQSNAKRQRGTPTLSADPKFANSHF
jgi:hypothetical protein